VDEATLTDASLLIGLGRFDEAEHVLDEMLNRAAADGDTDLAGRALEGLGTIATRRGQEARALELFERAIERGGGPDPAERTALYTNTARLRSYTGDADGAIALLQECITRVAARPDHDTAAVAQYSITLSYALADAGRFGNASAVLADVLREAEDLDLPVRRRLYYALTRLNMNIGRIDLAVEYSERNLATTLEAGANTPDVHETYLQCAHVRLDANDTAQAGVYLEHARRNVVEPFGAVDEGFLMLEEARHALQCGEHEEAMERARGAVDRLSDESSVSGQRGLAYLVIARAYEDTGDDDRADRFYLYAIDSLRRQTGWPTYLAKAYRRYGKFLRRTGRPEAAIEMLELASETGF
jgi:tetratricopeptide (TPR) repeat protein